MLSLSMVVPAYNEEELVEEFLQKSVQDLSAVAEDWEIILVNDGSTDRTSELAHRFAREVPQVKVVDLAENVGNGANVEVGFRQATRDIVFNNTVDAFFNTEDLRWILPHFENYDSISGYRTDLSANNAYQKLLTTVNRGLIRLLFPLKLKAYQTVQFHRRELFEQIEVEGRSSFVSPELLLKAHYLGYSIGEVPVVFHPRTRGTAKGGGIKHVLRSMRDIFRFWFKWVILRRPLSVRRPVAVREPGEVLLAERAPTRKTRERSRAAG
ncbi:MAG: glycosyltransferase family 2 protein [Armatimonadetes bacterium]|nr:glycosyltransferase family 2 protein [Armatimonadota bacterium]